MAMNKKLDEFKKLLKNAKVAVIGAGVSNIPLISYLANLECDITLFDKKELNDMTDKAKEIIKETNIKYFLGDDYLENLKGFDIIFRSPSLLPTNKYLEEEKKRGATITTEIEQVMRNAPCKVIGVTGSKGKTTTTTVIYNILKGMGYNTYLGGNIGVPLFEKLDEMKEDDIVVLELSSFQLMSMPVSPDIAVITNISPDHLDIHKNYDEYIDAKKEIFKHQTKDNILVLNSEDEIVSSFENESKSKIRYFGSKRTDNCYYLEDNFIKLNGKEIIDTSKLILKGRHNYLNVCAALNAVKDYICVSEERLEEIIKNIKGVHHRLEFVRNIDGVNWYNDSASTTPDKTLAGLNAFDEDIILIAGGYDKNISYEPLAKPILDKVSKLILFGKTKDKIYDEVMKLKKKIGSKKDIQIYVMDTLEDVVGVAKEVSTKGEVVLFSPASASFDMFNNAYERGDIFKDLVNKM